MDVDEHGAVVAPLDLSRSLVALPEQGDPSVHVEVCGGVADDRKDGLRLLQHGARSAIGGVCITLLPAPLLTGCDGDDNRRLLVVWQGAQLVCVWKEEDKEVHMQVSVADITLPSNFKMTYCSVVPCEQQALWLR